MQHGPIGGDLKIQVTDQGADLAGTITDWGQKLKVYRDRIRDEPQSNPIRLFAMDISRALEAGYLSREDLTIIAKELCDRALIRRAYRMRTYFGELDPQKRADEFRELVRASAKNNGQLIPFEEFAKYWERAREGIVFTAHPTFLMSEKLRSVMVRLVDPYGTDSATAREDLKTISHTPDKHISLISEHSQVQQTIQHTQDALARISRIILEVAKEFYPDQWTSLVPKAVTINCWVGYDLDGRTDIRWSDSFRFRLEEKHRQVERFSRLIRQTAGEPAVAGDEKIVRTLNELADAFDSEVQVLRQHVMLFGQDLSAPDRLAQAANTLTQQRSSSISTSLKGVIDTLTEAISSAPSDDARMVLSELRTAVANHGLGTAKIHIRINAMQLHNAIRKSMGFEGSAAITSRTMWSRLDEMVAGAKAETVNFASLAMEQTTAIRQFMAISQIVKHIDSDAPVRLLIAECEHPFTVLAALYYARVFGVAEQVDISPLLETEEALEKGARIIEGLLKSEEYRKQVQQRGRLCVQTGFSDAGRFVGQIPAALAIERLHAKLCDAVKKSGLTDVEVLIFDTHGESIGRGTHPGSMKDRFAYNISPWVRQRYKEANIPLHHEVSFQGGDGYAFLGTPDLAFAVLCEQLNADSYDVEKTRSDAFYKDADFARDYFEHIKTYQTRLFEDENYGLALVALGTNLLSKSGSRKTKRQFDAGSDNRRAAAQMRAIPHNALLQQLGYLLNIVSGIGVALKYRQDRFAEVYEKSDRVKRLISMVVQAKQLSSIKTLVAYAGLFDDAYWVTRPLNDLEPKLKEPCLLLADQLRGDKRHDGMMHLASYLRDDAVFLHDLLNAIGVDLDHSRLEGRDELDLLHALRIALIQHIYLLAAKVPRFSTRNDISHGQIMSFVLELRVEDAVSLMREAFPESIPKLSDFKIDEEASYRGDEVSGYEQINRELIDPMVSAFGTVKELGVGIAHHFGAHG